MVAAACAPSTCPSQAPPRVDFASLGEHRRGPHGLDVAASSPRRPSSPPPASGGISALEPANGIGLPPENRCSLPHPACRIQPAASSLHTRGSRSINLQPPAPGLRVIARPRWSFSLHASSKIQRRNGLMTRWPIHFPLDSSSSGLSRSGHDCGSSRRLHGDRVRPMLAPGSACQLSPGTRHGSWDAAIGRSLAARSRRSHSAPRSSFVTLMCTTFENTICVSAWSLCRALTH